MNKLRKTFQPQQHGFTIVELLIVIVVIAILAAIVIVAYNGVTSRANNSQTIASVAAYGRVLQSYAAQNGAYPIAANYPCLGPSGSQCANVSDGTGACNGAGATAYSAAFDSAVRTTATTLPGPSQQRIMCNGKQYVGAYYFSSDGKNATITYFLANTTDCGSPGGVAGSGNYTFAGGMMCYSNLPQL